MKQIRSIIRNIRWKTMGVSVAIPLAVGALSALLTAGSMGTYGAIRRPPLSPPGAVFPIEWTILFLLMGISCYFIYSAPDSGKKQIALRLYLIQLAVNFVWPLLFFNAQAFGLAFVWLLLLWGLVVAMLFAFYDVAPLAAWLQLPYLLWLTFAAYLSFGVLLLNV